MQEQTVSVRLVSISLIVVAIILMFNRTIYYGSTFFINLIFSIGMFLGPILVLLKRTKPGVIVSFVLGFFAFMKSSYLVETYTIFLTVVDSPLYGGSNLPSKLNKDFTILLSTCYMLLSGVGIFLAYPLSIKYSDKKIAITLFAFAILISVMMESVFSLEGDWFPSRLSLIFSFFMFIGPIIILFYRVKKKLGYIFSFCTSIYFIFLALIPPGVSFTLLFCSAWYMIITIIGLTKLYVEVKKGK